MEKYGSILQLSVVQSDPGKLLLCVCVCVCVLRVRGRAMKMWVFLLRLHKILTAERAH